MSKKIYTRDKNLKKRARESPAVTQINPEAAHSHAEGTDALAKPPEEILLPPDRSD